MAGNKFATIVANEKFIVDMEKATYRYWLRTAPANQKWLHL